MADDLMIEVTGSAKTAESALDRVTKKLETLKETFDRLAPSVKEFTDRMNSIASSSKAISSLKKITESTQRSALSAKDAESRMAMYQARLDRATLSMNKTRVASERLAAAQRKLNQASGIDAANQAFLNSFKYKGPSGVASSYLPTPDTTPSVTPVPGSSRLASSIVDAQSTAQKAAFNINTTPALTKLQEVQAYIESLTPSVSKMSSKAQSDFQGLSSKLTLLAQQIDNQRAMWSKLASAQGQAASKFGENSNQALKLEKQMLSTDSAIGRLIDKQDKLKAKMSQITDATKKSSGGFFSFGKAGEDSAKKSVSGMTKLLRMVKSVTISLLTFKALTAIQQGFQTGIQNIAQASSEANYYLSAIATSSLYMKNSLGAALMPVIQALTPYITGFTDALANLFNTIGMLTARIFNGATSVTIAKKANVDYAASLGKSNTAAKELQRTIAGFDEINALSNPSSDSASSAAPGMPNVGTMFETVDVPNWVDKIGSFTDKIKNLVSGWWNGLTDAQKWGAGLGGSAGAIIGGIIGKLIGGPMGAAIGVMLGGVVGTVIGTWWAGLTEKQKWYSGIGAGAGALIGGFVGNMIAGPLGAKVGALLGAGIGGIAGAWWAELTNKQKWAAGIGAGAGATIGGIIGGLVAGPIGIAIGATFGGIVGAVTGKWWTELTAEQKWKVGAGAAAGATIGGIVGTLIAPGIGTVLGAALGGAIGTAITANWEKIKQWLSNIGENINKWCVDTWKNITSVFEEKWNALVNFFSVNVPQWLKSVGDWFNEIPYKLGYALGEAVANVLNFGTKFSKWVSEDLGVIIGNIQAWFDQLPGKIGTALSNALTSVVKWGANLVQTAKTEIPKFVQTVLTGLAILPIKATEIGKNLVAGIWDGIKGAASWLSDKIKEFCKGVTDGFNLRFEIHSPSRLFREQIGKNLALGLGYGFIDNMKSITDKMVSSVPNTFTMDAAVSFPDLSATPKLDFGPNIDFSESNNAFSGASYGIAEGLGIGNTSKDADRIISRLDSLEDAIKNMKMVFVANNREIAEASNAGNKLLDRARHPIASST